MVAGEEPYTAAEIASFVGGDDAIDFVTLAEDAYGAALLAGRAGGSRRAARCRLLRSAAAAAPVLSTRLRAARSQAEVITR
jgi:hypothetical protein